MFAEFGWEFEAKGRVRGAGLEGGTGVSVMGAGPAALPDRLRELMD